MGLFTNIFLLYCCVSIAIMFYSPSMVLGTSPQAQTVLSFFDIDATNMTNPSIGASFNNDTNLGLSDANSRLLAEGRTTDRDSTAVTNIFLSIIDPIWNVIMYISLFFRVLFCIVIILNALNAPFYITFIIGLPLNFLGLLSLVAMIRGYN